MKKLLNKKQHLLCLLAVVLLIAATAWFLFKDRELGELLRMIGSVDVSYLLAGLFIIILFYFLEGRGLQVLLRPLAGKIGFLRATEYAYIDFYFSSITPGCCGGQPSQIYFMHRDDIPVSSSSLALLCFYMCYHAAILLLAAAAMIFAGEEIIGQMGAFAWLLLYGIIAKLLIIAFYFTAVFHKEFAASSVSCVIKILSKLHILRKPEETKEKAAALMEDYRKGAMYIKEHPLMLLRIMVIVTGHLLALYSIPFWVCKAFSLGGISFLQIIALQTALTVSVESLPIPGGIGVTEGGFMVIYSDIFGADNVVPVLLLSRMLNYYFGLITGGIITSVSLLRSGHEKRVDNTTS